MRGSKTTLSPAGRGWRKSGFSERSEQKGEKMPPIFAGFGPVESFLFYFCPAASLLGPLLIVTVLAVRYRRMSVRSK
jgi:hypothetical protein